MTICFYPLLCLYCIYFLQNGAIRLLFAEGDIRELAEMKIDEKHIAGVSPDCNKVTELYGIKVRLNLWIVIVYGFLYDLRIRR